MKISFEGREWTLDIEDVDVKQATVLYLTYHMTLREWLEGLEQIDARAFHFAYWLMLAQNGVTKAIADCNPKIFAFAAAFGEGQEEEEAAGDVGAEPGPTSPPSTPPGPPSPEPSIPLTTTRQPVQVQRPDAIASWPYP